MSELLSSDLLILSIQPYFILRFNNSILINRQKLLVDKCKFSVENKSSKYSGFPFASLVPISSDGKFKTLSNLLYTLSKYSDSSE